MPASLLRTSVHRHRRINRATIHVAGELDLDSAPALSEVLNRCLDQGIRTLDVDVHAVTFCDASGLGALLAVARRARAQRATLHLRRPSRQLSRILELTGTGAVLLSPAVQRPPRTPAPATGRPAFVRAPSLP